MRILLALVALTSIAHAGPPSGYQCELGKANVGVGCLCPEGYRDVRDDEDIATCKRDQDSGSNINAECRKLGREVFAGTARFEGIAGLLQIDADPEGHDREGSVGARRRRELGLR